MKKNVLFVSPTFYQLPLTENIIKKHQYLDEVANVTVLAFSNQKIAFQGNLDPKFLLENSQNIRQKIKEILFAFRERPHIFNLGHGVLPKTSIEKVEEMLSQIRST